MLTEKWFRMKRGVSFSIFSNMIKPITSLLLALCLTSCDTMLDAMLETPSTSSGRPTNQARPANQVLSQAQVARIFFEAYKNHDRAAAAKVASPEALNKLSWSWDPVPPSNLRLEQTGGYAIAYDGGSIQLVFNIGNYGANVADVVVTAD